MKFEKEVIFGISVFIILELIYQFVLPFQILIDKTPNLLKIGVAVLGIIIIFRISGGRKLDEKSSNDTSPPPN